WFGNAVAYKFKNVGIRRQCKYRHHQTLDSRSQLESIVRMRQMVQEIAVEKCFALFLQTNGGVQLCLWFARQQAAQEMDIGRWDFHVNEEVGAGKAEQGTQVVRAMQQSINIYMTRRRLQQSDRERIRGAVIDDPTHDIGA